MFIKEIRYISGAHSDIDGDHCFNDETELSVILHGRNPVNIEMRFSGLYAMHLFPEEDDASIWGGKIAFDIIFVYPDCKFRCIGAIITDGRSDRSVLNGVYRNVAT